MDIRYCKWFRFWSIIRCNSMVFQYFFNVWKHILKKYRNTIKLHQIFQYIKQTSKYHRTASNYTSKSGSFIVSNIYWNTIENVSKLYWIISNSIEFIMNPKSISILWMSSNCIEISMTYRAVIRKFLKINLNF